MAAGILLRGASSVQVNATSTNFTITVVDEFENATNVVLDTTFGLMSDSAGTVTFTPVTPATVPAGHSTATFTYQDSLTGNAKTVTTTATGGDLTGPSDTHDVNVTAAPSGGTSDDPAPSPTPTPPPTLFGPTAEPVVTRTNEVSTVVTAGEPTVAETQSSSGGTAGATAPANALPDGATLTAASIDNLEELTSQAPPGGRPGPPGLRNQGDGRPGQRADRGLRSAG